MLKILSKFVLTIFPSVAASVIGAYIAHNYINARPAERASAVAAAASRTDDARADDSEIGGLPNVIAIPVNAKVATEASGATSEPPQRSATFSAPERMPASRERRSAVHMRTAHTVKRTSTSEHARGVASATPLPQAGPVVMPAVDLVPPAQTEAVTAAAPANAASGAARADSGRFMPSVEIPLLKRLASFSNDVETELVSRTMSTADDIATAAKSAFRVVMPR